MLQLVHLGGANPMTGELMKRGNLGVDKHTGRKQLSISQGHLPLALRRNQL